MACKVYFWGTTGCPELAISGSCMMTVFEVKMFLLAVFLLLIFSVLWRWWEIMSKNLRFNMTINMLINNDASIQVELGLSIVEIYVDQHSKS